MIQETIEGLYLGYNYPVSFKDVLTALAKRVSGADVERILATYESAEGLQFANLSALLETLAVKYATHRFTMNLFALILLLPRFRQFCAQANVEKKVVEDTIGDIRYKYNECKQVHDVDGVSAWEGWYEPILQLRLFQIGRLQYEYQPFLFDVYEKDGKVIRKGEEVLSVHIPATGTPLSHEECVRSYEQAKAFFAEHFAGRQMTFICWSWLLNPDNETFMDEKSNIIRFKRDYDVIDREEYPDYNVLAPWIFGRKEVGDLAPTDTDTSLQRRVKAHLAKGGKLGRGYGVFFA